MDEEGWEEIKGASIVKTLSDRYFISESEVYQEIRNGNSEIISAYMQLIKAAK
jgi:hypothetical protein